MADRLVIWLLASLLVSGVAVAEPTDASATDQGEHLWTLPPGNLTADRGALDSQRLWLLDEDGLWSAALSTWDWERRADGGRRYLAAGPSVAWLAPIDGIDRFWILSNDGAVPLDPEGGIESGAIWSGSDLVWLETQQGSVEIQLQREPPNATRTLVADRYTKADLVASPRYIAWTDWRSATPASGRLPSLDHITSGGPEAAAGGEAGHPLDTDVLFFDRDVGTTQTAAKTGGTDVALGLLEGNMLVYHVTSLAGERSAWRRDLDEPLTLAPEAVPMADVALPHVVASDDGLVAATGTSGNKTLALWSPQRGRTAGPELPAGLRWMDAAGGLAVTGHAQEGPDAVHLWRLPSPVRVILDGAAGADPGCVSGRIAGDPAARLVSSVDGPPWRPLDWQLQDGRFHGCLPDGAVLRAWGPQGMSPPAFVAQKTHESSALPAAALLVVLCALGRRAHNKG